MANEFPYRYDKSSRKFPCPNCNHKSFVRFVDNQTGEYLPERYGRCDRENNCGYGLRPATEKNGCNTVESGDFKRGCNNENSEISTVPVPDVERTLNIFADNFSRCITGKYGDSGKEALRRYNVGSCTKGTVFWQRDISQVYRGGKIIEYQTNGRRTKNIIWEHALNKRENFTLKQCLFGSHLIKTGVQRVFVVESEKTAVIGSILFSDKIFLATGGSANIGLAGKLNREIKKIFIPDCGQVENWSEKTKEFENSFVFSIEKHCTPEETESGADIADLWLRGIMIEPKEPTNAEKYSDFIDNLDIPLKEIPGITVWRGIDICRQTMTIIQGKPKAKKSALAQLICADILRQNSKVRILYFDTEMSEKSVRIRTLSVAKLANIHNFSERFIKIKCRKMLNSERKDFVFQAINDFKCDIVVIDGIIDLINDFNKIDESTNLIAELNKCTAQNDCHLILLLHQNKNNESGQGHLGYFLEKKCDTLINIKFVNRITSQASLKYDRDGGSFKDFDFGFGENGLQYFGENVEYEPAYQNYYETEKEDKKDEDLYWEPIPF
jgi:hypothetical protein